MNAKETAIVKTRHDEAFSFIRSQNTLKKSQRDHRAIAKAKKVRDTTDRWLKE